MTVGHRDRKKAKVTTGIAGAFAAIALAAITPAGAKPTDNPTIAFVPAAGTTQPAPPSGPTVFGSMTVQITNPGGPVNKQKVIFPVPRASYSTSMQWPAPEIQMRGTATAGTARVSCSGTCFVTNPPRRP